MTIRVKLSPCNTNKAKGKWGRGGLNLGTLLCQDTLASREADAKIAVQFFKILILKLEGNEIGRKVFKAS